MARLSSETKEFDCSESIENLASGSRLERTFICSSEVIEGFDSC